jgi:WD40 repeat protein
VVTASDDRTARIWSARTGEVLQVLRGHSSKVWSAAFSPDGARVVTASEDNTARIWSARTGEELRVLEGHTVGVRSAAFSPDGARVVTASGEFFSEDGTARIWSARTGEQLRVLRGHGHGVFSAAFSPDGARVVTASEDGTARIWSARTGEQLRVLRGHSSAVTSAAFSPDGARVVTAGSDRTARIWSARTGEQLRVLRGHSDAVGSAAFSPDGARVVTAGSDRTARIWSARTGEQLRVLRGHSSAVLSAAFSPDGARVVTASEDGTARIWSARTGEQLRVLRGHTDWVLSAAFSLDGARVVTAGGELMSPSEDGTARIWSARTGEQLRVLRGHSSAVTSAAFSPDGARVVTAGQDSTARIWSARTGEQLRVLRGHSSAVFSAAFSPDGARVVTASYDRTARIWSAQTGEQLRVLEGHSNEVFSAAFSPDGARVVTASWDDTARIWSARTGEQLRVLRGHSDEVWSAAFSPDGARIVTASLDGTARTWSAQTGEELRVLRGHSSVVISAAFSPDGTQVITASADGTVRLWDAETGDELAQLMSFRDGTWAVTDPAGRYDAANGGDVDGLLWVAPTDDGLEPIQLQQLKDRYYDPGLLAKKMGFSDEPLRDVQGLNDQPLDLYPEVEVDPVSEARTTVRLAARRGGIGPVRLFLNGNEVASDLRSLDGSRADAASSEDAASAAGSLTLPVDLAPHAAFVRPDTTNTLSVVAYNAEESLKSRRITQAFDADAVLGAHGATQRGVRPAGGASGAETPPEFFALVVGTGDYSGTALDLRYAGTDAVDFARALSVSASRLFGEERTHITTLSTAPSDTLSAERPTRERILAALDTLAARATAEDVLVLYFAGHGVVHGGQDGDFYYLTAEATSGTLTDAAVRRQVALSSERLTDAMTEIPALKRLLILDTCAAGRVVEQLTAERDIPGSQVRSLSRLKDRTGTYVLAGSAADAVSYEATRFGQGLLTWSLLAGMRGEALKEEVEVDVSRLVNFAADRVPELARSIGGIQRPLLAMPRGGASFPIGHVRPEDQPKIPLAVERPMFLGAQFQDEAQFADHLGLARRVNERLRDVSYRGEGGEAPLIFVDATQYAKAYRVVGRYRTEGDAVEVDVRLIRDGTPQSTFVVTGSEDAPEALAEQIVSRILQTVSEGGL